MPRITKSLQIRIKRKLSYWHHETFYLRELFLIAIKGEKPLSLHCKRSSYVQYIKTAMSARQGVGGGKSLGLIYQISKVTDLDLKSATGSISLKLRPEQRGLARCDCFPKLRET